MGKFEQDDYCFACGASNPIGLKLKIEKIEEGVVRSIFKLRKEFQGFKGIVHGGIVATILDELMVWASFIKGYYVATAKLEIKYRAPVPVETELLGIGKVVDKSGRKVTGKGQIIKDGKVLAEANSLMIIVKGAE